MNPLEIFEVFRDGRVLLPSGKLTYGSADKRGYMRVSFKGKFFYVHRLVAMQYLENIEGFPQVNHKDMDTSNNSVENLEWCSNSYNTLHSIENNPDRKYVTSGNARKSKLTNEQVMWVLDNLGQISQREMSRVLGVSHRVIYQIKNGITHSNITGIVK